MVLNHHMGVSISCQPEVGIQSDPLPDFATALAWEPGLLHSRKSFLACQGMQSFVELITQFPSGVGEITGSTASQQSRGRVVEHRQHAPPLSLRL